MDKLVQARLDDESRKALELLKKQTGWRSAEILRRAIISLARQWASPEERQIVGLGQFESNITDLGSNKRHLQGFGG